MTRRPLQPAQRPIRRAAATRAVCSAAETGSAIATARPHAPTDDSPVVAA